MKDKNKHFADIKKFGSYKFGFMVRNSLRAEIIIKDNAQLLNVLEKVKGMDGVNDTVWSEIVQVVGRKRSIPSDIIDRL